MERFVFDVIAIYHQVGTFAVILGSNQLAKDLSVNWILIVYPQGPSTPGWTLRDAIENFCEWFKVDRGQIILERPFLPQRVLCDDCK